MEDVHLGTNPEDMVPGVIRVEQIVLPTAEDYTQRSQLTKEILGESVSLGTSPRLPTDTDRSKSEDINFDNYLQVLKDKLAIPPNKRTRSDISSIKKATNYFEFFQRMGNNRAFSSMNVHENLCKGMKIVNLPANSILIQIGRRV